MASFLLRISINPGSGDVKIDRLVGSVDPDPAQIWMFGS